MEEQKEKKKTVRSFTPCPNCLHPMSRDTKDGGRTCFYCLLQKLAIKEPGSRKK